MRRCFGGFEAVFGGVVVSLAFFLSFFFGGGGRDLLEYCWGLFEVLLFTSLLFYLYLIVVVVFFWGGGFVGVFFLLEAVSSSFSFFWRKGEQNRSPRSLWGPNADDTVAKAQAR